MGASEPDREFLAVLDRWGGSQVVVRVISAASDDLVAVFTGRLQGRSEAKHPALFWPVESSDSPKAERPGIYLHANLYEGAQVHEGQWVVEFSQAGVVTKIRRLDRGRSMRSGRRRAKRLDETGVPLDTGDREDRAGGYRDPTPRRPP
jgi:hypothetical protein